MSSSYATLNDLVRRIQALYLSDDGVRKTRKTRK